MKILYTILLLSVSNIFMTFAWYGHLKNLADKPIYIAVFISWGIALLEYNFMVPANRIGKEVLDLGQLKIIQEAITLTIFIPFSLIYMKEPWNWNYLWACLCLLGSIYFIFR